MRNRTLALNVAFAALLIAGCETRLPRDITPDALVTPSDCFEITDPTRNATLIGKVRTEIPSYLVEHYSSFHYVAYDCGPRYDLVRWQLVPEMEGLILDGGSSYYIDRNSGEVVYEFHEG